SFNCAFCSLLSPA
ncbi:hypothetical protein D037_4113B, partial [Vibrio parahaemolyticus IDH02640]